ncbi:MAG: hypothetical protein ABII00_10275, partial [Elusimicrobiota bacterium]
MGNRSSSIGWACFSASALIVLGLSGCANPYKTNFKSVGGRYPSYIHGQNSASDRKPLLRITTDLKAEGRKLYENGYIKIGFSQFNAPLADEGQALAEASRIGADVVVVERDFSQSVSETVPKSYYPPQKTTTVRSQSTRTVGDKQEKMEKQLEITTGGDLETYFVEQRTDFFEQTATFWKKFDNPVFGAYVADLGPEDRVRLQTNRGL